MVDGGYYNYQTTLGSYRYTELPADMKWTCFGQALGRYGSQKAPYIIAIAIDVDSSGVSRRAPGTHMYSVYVVSENFFFF